MNTCMKKHYGATFMNGEVGEEKHVTFNALAENVYKKFHTDSHISPGATKLFLASSSSSSSEICSNPSLNFFYYSYCITNKLFREFVVMIQYEILMFNDSKLTS